MKKILVVEDDVELQTIYKTKLTHENFECIMCFKGLQAVEMAQTQMPDLIILDVMLPDSPDGFIILKELKSNPKTHSIPVILATNIENQVLQAIDAGAVWYFVKAQTSIQTITDKIKSILNP